MLPVLIALADEAHSRLATLGADVADQLVRYGIRESQPVEGSPAAADKAATNPNINHLRYTVIACRGLSERTRLELMPGTEESITDVCETKEDVGRPVAADELRGIVCDIDHHISQVLDCVSCIQNQLAAVASVTLPQPKTMDVLEDELNEFRKNMEHDCMRLPVVEDNKPVEKDVQRPQADTLLHLHHRLKYLHAMIDQAQTLCSAQDIVFESEGGTIGKARG